MSARGKHHRPAPLNRRLLSGIVAGVIALVLVLEGGTGALFYQSAKPSTGSVTSAQEQLAIGGSSSTITLSSAATVGYSPVVTLSNTGNSRNALPFVDSAVSVGSDPGSLQSKIKVVWVTTTTTDCSNADYNHNVVLSSTSLSLPSGARSIGGSGAPTIDPSGSVKLCGQFTLTDTSAAAGSSVTATFSFIGWDVSFESNTVSYSQAIKIGSVAPSLNPPVNISSCQANTFTNDSSGTPLLNYSFNWWYPTIPGNWRPAAVRITWTQSPSSTQPSPPGYPLDQSNNYSYGVYNLRGYSGIYGTFTIVGLDTVGGAAMTEPATITFNGTTCTYEGSS